MGFEIERIRSVDFGTGAGVGVVATTHEFDVVCHSLHAGEVASLGQRDMRV